VLLTGSGIKIGKIGGHELYLDPISFAFLGVYLYLNAGGDYAWLTAFLVAMVFSVLVHELGHAVAIQWLTGQHTAIVIGFGGVTLYAGTRKPGSDLLISLAGPLAGAALGFVGWLLAGSLVEFRSWEPWAFDPGDSIWLMTLQILIWGSVWWTILNLLPAIPLDGGHALRSLLTVVGLKPSKARRYSRFVSIAVAASIILYQQQSGASIILLFIALMIILRCMDEARNEGW
jgi:stage IV sporulation protein FB